MVSIIFSPILNIEHHGHLIMWWSPFPNFSPRHKNVSNLKWELIYLYHVCDTITSGWLIYSLTKEESSPNPSNLLPSWPPSKVNHWIGKLSFCSPLRYARGIQALPIPHINDWKHYTHVQTWSLINTHQSVAFIYNLLFFFLKGETLYFLTIYCFSLHTHENYQLWNSF